MSQAMLHVFCRGQETGKELLTFSLEKWEGEKKKAMEIKRVVRLRTAGQRTYSFRMWPHPIDVLKATQQGHQPQIIAYETSDRDEPDHHPSAFVAFKKKYPIDGAAESWWVPGMEVTQDPQPTPKAAAPVAAMTKAKAAPPPQPRAREEELERPAKKRSVLYVLNAHLSQNIKK